MNRDDNSDISVYLNDHPLGFDVCDELNGVGDFDLKPVGTHQLGQLNEQLRRQEFDPRTFVLAFEHFQPFFGQPWEAVLRFYLPIGFDSLRLKLLMKEAIASGKWESTFKWGPRVVVPGLPSAPILPSVAPIPRPAAESTVTDDIVTLTEWLQSNSPLTEAIVRTLTRVFSTLQE